MKGVTVEPTDNEDKYIIDEISTTEGEGTD